MSFLKRDINQEEIDTTPDREEQYKQLFPKIGRDFVTREDLDDAMRAILVFLDPVGSNPFVLSDTGARNIADRYKILLDRGKDGGESKRDLIPAEDMG